MTPTLVQLFLGVKIDRFFFVLNRDYSLETKVQLKFCFSEICNALTICQQSNSIPLTFRGSCGIFAKPPKLPSPSLHLRPRCWSTQLTGPAFFPALSLQNFEHPAFYLMFSLLVKKKKKYVTGR